MLLGILLMLAASAAYNSAPIMLRAATHGLPDRSPTALLRAVLTRGLGLGGLTLSLVGWGLEVVALSQLPLTLARALLAAGLVLLLILARRDLHEPIGRAEVLGVAAIVLGVAAVAVAPPVRGTATPPLLQWAAVLSIGGVIVLAPYLFRMAGAAAFAVSAGVGYGLSGLFTKQLADQFTAGRALPILLVLIGAGVSAVFGFTGEIEALLRGDAADAVPVYQGLQVLIPILGAPLLFGERWPVAMGPRLILTGGIALTIVGIVLGSRRAHAATDAVTSPVEGRLVQVGSADGGGA